MKTDSTIPVMELLSTIKPKQLYSAADIARAETFPWARDQRTIAKLIEQDMQGENILQASVSGEGRQRRYEMEGKNIIKYLTKYGAVLIATARKPKHYGKKK